MMQDLMKALPDDRPITAISIVEEPVNCPAGFQPVYKTFDQDIDADLWKDGLFGKKITRYICMSKEMQAEGEVITSIVIIGEKDPIPENYTVLMYTSDTEQRAMRKKLICYRAVKRNKAVESITDIIVLSKSKKPPLGFTLAGDVNGFTICFKLTTLSPERSPTVPVLPAPKPSISNILRPIHHIPVLDGVPFEINPKFKALHTLSEFILPSVMLKTADDINAEYLYDFSVEYQAQQGVTE